MACALSVFWSSCSKEAGEPGSPKELSAESDNRVSETYERQKISIEQGKRIQRALAQAGFYEGQINGLITEKTVEALKDFQRANRIVAENPLSGPTLKALGLETPSEQAQEEATEPMEMDSKGN